MRIIQQSYFKTTGINENDVLEVNILQQTFDVIVTYNPEITSQPSNLNSTLKIVLDYVQNE